MYYDYFGLSGPPFGPFDSPTALFLGAGHREGLAALQWGLREPSGFTMLVGEVGTGKTTLVRSLLESGCAGMRVAFVTNPTLSFEEILRLIARQLGFRPERIGKLELIEGLDSFISALAPHESVTLIFDEAQDLSDQTLEELRLLSNSQWPAGKRLQIVLVGQLELARRLESPGLRQLNQRIGARALLPTLRREEVSQYVEYRLRARGGEMRRLFARAALLELAPLSGGIPRRINMLCHNALVLAYAQQARCVSATHIREAANDYDHLLSSAGAPAARPHGWLIKLMAALPIGIAVLCLSYFVAPGALSTVEPAVHSVAPRLRAGILPKAPTTPQVQNQPPPEITKPAAGTECAITPAHETSPRDGIGAGAPQIFAADAPLLPQPKAPSQTARAPEKTAAAPFTQELVVVQPGDTLSKIVLGRSAGAAPANFRRQIAALIRSNPEITDPNHIYPGQIIRLQEASQLNTGSVPK
jgi:general secretion pathway protein A